MPFFNAAVNEVLQQLVPFFHDGLFQLIDSSKFSVMVDLLLQNILIILMNDGNILIILVEPQCF